MRESARERRTEMNKTNPSGMKGKKHSEETKEKMRKPKKNLENYKGRKWFHDPITKEQKWIYPSSIPTGWVKGRKNNDCR